MSWLYFEAPDARRFNYSKAPSFECDLAARVERLLAPGVVLAQDLEWPDEVAAAAAALGMTPVTVGRMIRDQHRRRSGRRRDGEKLTDRCAGCGRRLKRLGFRCWADRPYTDEELEEMGSVGNVSRRLTEAFGGEHRKTVRTFYVDTKREARAWAYEEYKIARATVPEATP